MLFVVFVGVGKQLAVVPSVNCSSTLYVTISPMFTSVPDVIASSEESTMKEGVSVLIMV